jgi:hypothetical protein
MLRDQSAISQREQPFFTRSADELTLLLIVASSTGTGTCCWPPSSLPGLVEDPGAPRKPDMQRAKSESLFFQSEEVSYSTPTFFSSLQTSVGFDRLVPIRSFSFSLPL